MTRMIPVKICDRDDWTVLMPEERAGRAQWPWHEWNRFYSMYHNLRPGDVLFDIGAEQGDQSALYAKWVAGGSMPRVVSSSPSHVGGIVLVEPNPQAWANIKAVWDANKLRDPIGCLTDFVGDKSTETEPRAMSWPPPSQYPISRHVGTASPHTDSAWITIDEVCLLVTHIPDAITIDIEGGELDALRGSERTLREYRPLVWVSIHWQMLLERGQSRQELIDYMMVLGYEHEHLGQDHEIHALFWHPDGRTPVLPYE